MISFFLSFLLILLIWPVSPQNELFGDIRRSIDSLNFIIDFHKNITQLHFKLSKNRWEFYILNGIEEPMKYNLKKCHELTRSLEIYGSDPRNKLDPDNLISEIFLEKQTEITRRTEDLLKKVQDLNLRFEDEIGSLERISRAFLEDGTSYLYESGIFERLDLSNIAQLDLETIPQPGDDRGLSDLGYLLEGFKNLAKLKNIKYEGDELDIIPFDILLEGTSGNEKLISEKIEEKKERLTKYPFYLERTRLALEDRAFTIKNLIEENVPKRLDKYLQKMSELEKRQSDALNRFAMFFGLDEQDFQDLLIRDKDFQFESQHEEL